MKAHQTLPVHPKARAYNLDIESEANAASRRYARCEELRAQIEKLQAQIKILQDELAEEADYYCYSNRG
jgi:cell division protein FtsB